MVLIPAGEFQIGSSTGDNDEKPVHIVHGLSPERLERNMRYAQIYMVILLMFVALSLHADDEGNELIIKVTKVAGDTITLNAGSGQGLEVGLKGRVYYVMKINDKDKRIYIANISVTTVKSDESTAKVESKSKNVELGHFAEIEGIQRGKGFLYITSSPSGADIYLDGKPTGEKTPAEIETGAGEHTIMLDLRNYDAVSATAQVDASKVSRVELQLIRSKATLTVRSTPLEAEVYLDGRLKGNTPLTIEDILAGNYELELRKPGYVTHRETIEATGGDTVVLRYTLETAKPELSVSPRTIHLDDWKAKEKITISNPGSATLNWSASSSAKGLEFMPKSGTVNPGMSAQLILSVSAEMKSGQYSVLVDIVGDGTSPASVQVGVDLPRGSMVLIPAGEFEMGTAESEVPSLVKLYKGRSSRFEDEMPRHRVYVDSFYMDRYEVTNAQYADFLNAYGGNTDPSSHELLDIDSSDCRIEKVGGVYRAKSGYADHPVIKVSWYGASAYAKFHAKRLPTEAEWEKAARGGLMGKKYLLGDSISHDDANYNGKGGRDKWEETSPIGSFMSNSYGLYDTSGNVWEWCSDWYISDYYAQSPRRNPSGPGIGRMQFRARVVRGGSWDSYANILRCASRYNHFPTITDDLVGFRCAQ